MLDSIAAQFGVAVGGWKVTLTNQAAMQRMNTDAPAVGPLFQPYIMTSPQLLNLTAEAGLGLRISARSARSKYLSPLDALFDQRKFILRGA